MNDGYVDLDENDYPINSDIDKIIKSDEKYKNYKYQVNLYYKLLKSGNVDFLDNFDSIVDVGCGRGGGISFYKNFYNFKNCIGIDLNEGSIEIAKKYNPDINFYVSSSKNLPLENNSVDIITCVESFNYYSPVINFIKESFRVLKNNGKIMISMPLTKNDEIVLENIFTNNNFVLYNKEDITKNVRTSCAISKYKYRDMSLASFNAISFDEQKYFNLETTYKNFVFIKKEI